MSDDKKKPVYIVASKVKELIKANDLRSNNDYLCALSDKVESMVKSAIERVKAEGKKKTLNPEDV